MTDHSFTVQSAQIRALEAALAAQTARAERGTAALDALHRSTSWRVTAPLRALAVRMRQRAPRETWIAPAMEIEAPEPLPPTGKPPRSVPQRAGALRVVHQFHPGVARGDAITQSMLLIQRILRGLGYASEIYCDLPDPALGDAVRPADTLPLHDRYALIVHVSLGHDGLRRIAALPAAKVLMYHNITPPEFLNRTPALQHYARLGQRQLAQWRPHVAAALADSEFNALDLRARGFRNVQACPLLFDIDAMRADAAQTVARTDDCFTMLFVGRLVQSKAQDDLIDAFARFRTGFYGPARLVLVGHFQSEDDPYVASLRRLIAAHGLGEQVVLTGFIEDDALQAWYRAADLYVSLSHHEGFGVPLIEAAARRVPVLAWPCGAVPATLGDGVEWLTDRTPAHVGLQMQALACDAGRRHDMALRQLQGLDRFRLKRHVPRLLQALALAGVALPEDADSRALLDAAQHVTITGHINGSYSLAAVNRALARSFEAIRPGRARLRPVETTDLSGVPSHEVAQTARLVERGRPASGPHVVISQHYPVHVPAERGDAALALFFWEESRVPIETIRQLNASFRGVLAPSAFVAKALVDSGVSVPVYPVGQAPDLSDFRAIAGERLGRGKVTQFLHVSSCFPRKGVDVLLAAYVRAFRRDDAVRLVIKGFPNRHNAVQAMVEQIRATDLDAPEITVINRDLGRAALLDLYGDSDVMVLPTRGEGFNLPAAEAMAAGLPLIVTGFGGHMDFCDATTARLLDWRFAASASHLADAGSLWVEPSEDDLAAALREAHAGPADCAARAEAAAALVAHLTDAALVRRITRAATDSLLLPPQDAPRVGWWRLGQDASWPPLPQHIAPQMLHATPPQDGAGLMTRIVARADPEILVIAHAPGAWSWAELGVLLLGARRNGGVIVLAVSDTAHLAALPPDETQAAIAALGLAGRVIVPGLADLARLQALGLGAMLLMLPPNAPDEAERMEGMLLGLRQEARVQTLAL